MFIKLKTKFFIIYDICAITIFGNNLLIVLVSCIFNLNLTITKTAIVV